MCVCVSNLIAHCFGFWCQAKKQQSQKLFGRLIGRVSNIKFINHYFKYISERSEMNNERNSNANPFCDTQSTFDRYQSRINIFAQLPPIPNPWSFTYSFSNHRQRKFLLTDTPRRCLSVVSELSHYRQPNTKGYESKKKDANKFPETIKMVGYYVYEYVCRSIYYYICVLWLSDVVVAKYD